MALMDECEERMRKLEASQHSIVETSELLLKVGAQDPSLLPFIVQLWQRLLVRSHKSKKVAYVYLVNDLLQKSIAQQPRGESSFFQRAFEPIIGPSLIGLFEN